MAILKISCLVTSWAVIFLCCLCCLGKSQEDFSNCGIRSVLKLAKVAGGRRSYQGQWPWQIAIYRATNKDGSGRKGFHCGGALVDKRWILTAAHCFYDDTNPKRHTITAGEHDITNEDSTEQVHQIRKILLHPDYDDVTYENDIAVAELSQDVTLNRHVRTICLPEADDNLSSPGAIVHVSGWGKTSEIGRFSTLLLHSSYQIRSNHLCKRATRHKFNQTVMFCTGDGREGRDTCEGDSGGSLVRPLVRNGAYRWVTVGLVSWGEGCARVRKYGYNTRMEPFVEWIRKTITECDDPGSPQNGMRIPNKRKYNYKDSVLFTCRTNYTRIGASSINCQRNGTWSGHQAACLAPCNDPGTPKEGIRLEHEFTHGKSVKFKCKKGSQPQSDLLITCVNGRWDNIIPKCIKMCARPNIYPVNGGVRGTSMYYRHKEYIRFYCRGGYQLVGQEYVRCRNGTWNSRHPTCKPVECRDPGTPRNGVRIPDKNKYVFEDRIDFQCRINYMLRGDRSITCQKDKSWSRSVPRCLAPCRDPGTPNNGQRVGNSFLHGNQVRFSCRQGWNIHGLQTISCNNGRWNQPTPECKRCDSPLGMESGKIPDGNIQASSTRDQYHTAKEGRLNGPRAWCSGRETQPYLEIDFGKPYRITGLATQGSAYDNRWVTWYGLRSSLAESKFVTYRENGNDKLFEGNKDTITQVRQKLRNPFTARRLRIYPVKQRGYYTYPACMRVEIYGCDLPLNCIVFGSRVVAKWMSTYLGLYIYLKAYLTNIGTRYWKVKLENENHSNDQYKFFQKYADLPFVLDVPPKHEELQVGTRVLVPWKYRYYTGTIRRTRDRYNRYQVRADDGDVGTFTIDQIRLLKAPSFCE